jgi:ribonuclease HI
MPAFVDPGEGGPSGAVAYADASLHGRDAAWAAVVYQGERPLRAAVGAGDAQSIGEAERRAILLAASLLRDIGRRGPIYSDSREAVEAAQYLVASGDAVTAVVWTPSAYNRAADVLSKLVRQTWQRVRKRRAVPTMLTGRAVPYKPLRPPQAVPRRLVAAGAGPRSLEQAILSLASEGVSARDLTGRIEARWPDLLALRGRPEHSVRDALDSLVRKGEASLDAAGAVVARRAAESAPSQAGQEPAPEA